MSTHSGPREHSRIVLGSLQSPTVTAPPVSSSPAEHLCHRPPSLGSRARFWQPADWIQLKKKKKASAAARKTAKTCKQTVARRKREGSSLCAFSSSSRHQQARGKLNPTCYWGPLMFVDARSLSRVIFWFDCSCINKRERSRGVKLKGKLQAAPCIWWNLCFFSYKFVINLCMRIYVVPIIMFRSLLVMFRKAVLWNNYIE